MPGTLYEPSPTPEPEERRVRFAQDLSPTLYQMVPQPASQPVDSRAAIMRASRSPSKLTLYDDLSSVTSPPSTADSDDVSISQDSRSSIPSYRKFEAPSRSTSHSGSIDVYNPLVSKSYVPPTTILSTEGSFSFASSSERSFEQERIRELEQEVQKLKEEVRIQLSMHHIRAHEYIAGATIVDESLCSTPSTSTTATTATRFPRDTSSI